MCILIKYYLSTRFTYVLKYINTFMLNYIVSTHICKAKSSDNVFCFYFFETVAFSWSKLSPHKFCQPSSFAFFLCENFSDKSAPFLPHCWFLLWNRNCVGKLFTVECEKTNLRLAMSSEIKLPVILAHTHTHLLFDLHEYYNKL